MRFVPLLMLATAAFAQDLPTYEVKRAAGRIAVDGKLDDKAWESAGTVELMFPWEQQTGAKQKTVARLLWDDERLYIAYDCQDQDITAQLTERDDPTYRDDAVEIFINPQPEQTDIYIGLEMNAIAVLYDYLRANSRYLFKRFQLQGVQLATDIRGTVNARVDKDQGWTLEVSIPWRNFEEFGKTPVEGTVWTANINRWDGVEPARRMSNWSDPKQPRPNPHVPARFGRLRFVK